MSPAFCVCGTSDKIILLYYNCFRVCLELICSEESSMQMMRMCMLMHMKE